MGHYPAVCRLCQKSDPGVDEFLSPHTGLCRSCTKANCRHKLCAGDESGHVECLTCGLVLSDEVVPLTQQVLNHAERVAKQMIPLICGIVAMFTYPIMLLYKLAAFAEDAAIATRDEAILDVYRKKVPEDEKDALAHRSVRVP